MIRIAKMFVGLLSGLIFGLGVSAASSQNILERLKQDFDTAPIQGDQYAVLIFNPSDRYIYPPMSPSNIGGGTGTRNWFFASGSWGAANHAETTIGARAFANDTNYANTFGDPVVSVAIYTRLGPCEGCATNISTIPRQKGWTVYLGFTNQWANQDDRAAFRGMRAMQLGGVNVYRICNTGESCRTFQRALLECAISKPIICNSCANRTNGITGFIDTQMLNEQTTRSPATWQTAIGANFTSQEERLQAMQAWNSCLNTVRNLPVEALIGANPLAPPSIRSAPTNWQAVTGERVIIPSHHGGPACGGPGMMPC